MFILQANNGQGEGLGVGRAAYRRAEHSSANGKGTAEKSARQDRAENRAGSSSVYTSKGVLYMDKERFEKGDAVYVIFEDGTSVILVGLCSLLLNAWSADQGNDQHYQLVGVANSGSTTLGDDPSLTDLSAAE